MAKQIFKKTLVDNFITESSERLEIAQKLSNGLPMARFKVLYGVVIRGDGQGSFSIGSFSHFPPLKATGTMRTKVLAKFDGRPTFPFGVGMSEVLVKEVLNLVKKNRKKDLQAYEIEMLNIWVEVMLNWEGKSSFFIQLFRSTLTSSSEKKQLTLQEQLDEATLKDVVDSLSKQLAVPCDNQPKKWKEMQKVLGLIREKGRVKFPLEQIVLATDYLKINPKDSSLIHCLKIFVSKYSSYVFGRIEQNTYTVLVSSG